MLNDNRNNMGTDGVSQTNGMPSGKEITSSKSNRGLADSAPRSSGNRSRALSQIKDVAGKAQGGLFKGAIGKATASAGKSVSSLFAKVAVTTKAGAAIAASVGMIGLAGVGYAGMNMNYEKPEAEYAGGSISDARITFLSAYSESSGNPLQIEGCTVGPGIGTFQFTSCINGVTDYLVGTGNSLYNPLKPFAGKTNEELKSNHSHWEAWASVVDAPVEAGMTYGTDYINKMNLAKANVFIDDQTTYALNQYLYNDSGLGPETNNGYDIRNASDVIKAIAFSTNILFGVGTGRAKAFEGVSSGMSDVDVINLCYDNLVNNSSSLYTARWVSERQMALQMESEGSNFNPFVKLGKVDWTWRNSAGGSKGNSTNVSSDSSGNASWASKAEEGDIIFIGDSRTVGMQQNVSSNATFICKTGSGYNWMVDTAFAKTDRIVENGKSVVILMGVNDIENASLYVDAVNKKAKEWKGKGAATYFVSVNAVDDEKTIYVKNSQIRNFNNILSNGLSEAVYIDTNSYLDIGNSDTDSEGLHYTGEIYNKIYNIIISRIRGSSGTSAGNNVSISNNTNALRNEFLNCLQKYSDQVREDKEKGIVWNYLNSSPRATWDQLMVERDEVGKATCNCSLLVRWGLREIGILAPNQDFWDSGPNEKYGNDILYFKNDEKLHVREALEKYCTIMENVNRTPDELLAEGNLYPGDILGWVGMGHTNVYAGDGKYYDAGHAGDGNYGSDGQYYFNSFGPCNSINNSSQKVQFIIRIVGQEEDEKTEKLHIDWKMFDWRDWQWSKAGNILPLGWRDEEEERKNASGNVLAAENAKKLQQQAIAHGWKYCDCYAAGSSTHRGGICPVSGAYSFDCSWTVYSAYNGGNFDGLTLMPDNYKDGSSKMPAIQTGQMLKWMVENHPDKLLTDIVPFGSHVPWNQINMDKLEPGDILLFTGSDTTPITYNGATVTTNHVNIYVGDGQFVDGGCTPMQLYTDVSGICSTVVAIYRP